MPQAYTGGRNKCKGSRMKYSYYAMSSIEEVQAHKAHVCSPAKKQQQNLSHDSERVGGGMRVEKSWEGIVEKGSGMAQPNRMQPTGIQGTR